MLSAYSEDGMTNDTSPKTAGGLLAPKMLARMAAIVQTIVIVLLTTDRISSNGAVPLLALGMILWIIAFAQLQKSTAVG